MAYDLHESLVPSSGTNGHLDSGTEGERGGIEKRSDDDHCDVLKDCESSTDSNGEDDDSDNTNMSRPGDGSSSSRLYFLSSILSPLTPIVTSSTASSRGGSTVTSTPSKSPNSSVYSILPTSASPAGDNGSGKASEGLGTVTGIVLGSVLGAVAAVLILFTLVWLAICARKRGLTPAYTWKFWNRKKDYMRQRREKKSTEYRKPELDAIETAVGYNTGAPHEIYVTRVGYDSSAEMNAVKSPVELSG
ncbi:hypothetical protein F5Y03DRAFT_127523 [Xylaria venustula]|nr:hypothetical protein F5Y03DRAFT_127523 [Xylaria venustula]